MESDKTKSVYLISDNPEVPDSLETIYNIWLSEVKGSS